MQKQYQYKDFEKVFIHKFKKPGVVVNTPENSLMVEYYDGEQMRHIYVKPHEISHYDPNYKSKHKPKDKIICAKVRNNAKLLNKRYEDGAYDIWASFEENELLLKKGESNLIPTGIATAFSPKYRLNFKHERSSTGLYGMAILSGMIDSGYRGEIKINIIPQIKDIVISKVYPFQKNEKGKLQIAEYDNYFVYPYEFAIAQGTLEEVPDVIVEETTLEKLQAIPSVRGKDGYGSTN